MERKISMGSVSKTGILIILLFLAITNCKAQSNRTPELRSCFTSEIALAITENADDKKSWDENVATGKKIGYVIAEFYQKAIWAMDNAEIEGRAVLMYAFENSQERAKHMSKEQLKRDVARCRKSFN